MPDLSAAGFTRTEIDPADLLDGARTIPAGAANTCAGLQAERVGEQEYLAWAREALDRMETQGFTECIANAKRAVCRRLDALLLSNHLVPFYRTNYPRKIEALGGIGIEVPQIVNDLVIAPRNTIEHEYLVPSEQDARRARDIAQLVIDATANEASRAAIVALGWNVLGSELISCKHGHYVSFRGFGSGIMLFVDVFEQPHAAKLVEASSRTIRASKLSAFKGHEALELASLLRRHYDQPSTSTSGHGVLYYQEMKTQGGF